MVQGGNSLFTVTAEQVKFGKLDYKPKEIMMRAETVLEQKRLDSCAKEPQTVQWLERAVRADDIVYDVGASVGAYTLVAGTLLGPQGRCYAFEPAAPSMYSLFVNVAVNKMADRCIPLPYALSDKEGIEFLSLSSLHPGAASHGKNTPGQHYPQPIITLPIDTVIERFKIPAPNLVKIDVDKNDILVLAGARKTLGNPKLREVLIEVDEKVDEERRFVENIMFQNGFRFKEKQKLISSLEQDVWNRLYVRREA